MNTFSKTALATALLATIASAPALAYEKGDFIARAGYAHVEPDDDESSSFDGAAVRGTGTTVGVSNDASLGLTFSYMFTDHLAAGVLAAYPFEHDIRGESGALRGAGKVGETKHLPPTVTLQWHFNPGWNLHPYIGAGVNYTYFWDEKTTGVLSGTNLDLENSWGLAGEVGLDYTFANDFLVSAQVFYIDIDTTADSSLAGEADVDIDPWVFMVGLGKKF
jgi:outer membrane protein